MSGPGKEHRRTAPRSPPSLCSGGGRRAARSGAAGRTPWSGATQSGNAACGPRHLRDLRPLTSPSLVLPGRRWRQTHLVCRVTVRTASDRGRASVGGRDDAAAWLPRCKAGRATCGEFRQRTVTGSRSRGPEISRPRAGPSAQGLPRLRSGRGRGLCSHRRLGVVFQARRVLAELSSSWLSD